MRTPRFITGLLTAALIALSVNAVIAQDYPTKPIRLITDTIGGANDIMARLIGQGVAGPLGQPMVIDNRATSTMPEILAKAPPDGYTLLIGGGNLWVAPLLQKMSYDPIKDIAPVTLVSTEASVMVVIPSLGVNSVKEIIALAKAKPGQLNYASAGPGTSPHLAMELFKSMTGTDIVRIDYKGGGPSVIGLLAGEVQMRIGSAGTVAPQVKAGKLKALAITAAQPSPLYPGLPPIAATVPGYEAVGITGVFAPGKTSNAIITRLNREIVRVLNQADVKEKMFNLGQDVVGSSADELAVKMKADMTRWSKVIKDAGLKVE